MILLHHQTPKAPKQAHPRKTAPIADCALLNERKLYQQKTGERKPVPDAKKLAADKSKAEETPPASPGIENEDEACDDWQTSGPRQRAHKAAIASCTDREIRATISGEGVVPGAAAAE